MLGALASGIDSRYAYVFEVPGENGPELRIWHDVLGVTTAEALKLSDEERARLAGITEDWLAQQGRRTGDQG